MPPPGRCFSSTTCAGVEHAHAYRLACQLERRSSQLRASLEVTHSPDRNHLRAVAGSVGVVLAPHGRLARVLTFTMAGGRIAKIEVVADLDRLREIDLAVLNG